MDSSHKDDILNLGSSANYDHKGYQINQYNTILRSLWSVFKTFTTHQETLNQVETERFEILKPNLENLHSVVINVKNSLSAANFQVAEVCRSEIAIVDLCSLILKEMSRFRLPELKSRYLEWSDACPGVGITNNEVCYRTAQRSELLMLIISYVCTWQMVTAVTMRLNVAKYT